MRFSPIPKHASGADSSRSASRECDISEILQELDRVAWCSILGTYQEFALAPADRVVLIPPDISFEQAAEVRLQGMTAHYLSHSAYPIRKGDEILVHAGAGGVSLLLTQMAKTLGARVTAVLRGTRLRSHLKQVQTRSFSTRKWICGQDQRC